MSLLSTDQRKNHPRRQIQTLRRMAQIAMNKGNIERAQAAIDEMTEIDIEHQLGYRSTTK